MLQARAQELFEHVRDNLRHAGVLDLCGAGMVLTGGGARLNAIAEPPSRSCGGRCGCLCRPRWTKCPPNSPRRSPRPCIGMIFYGNRMRMARSAQEQGFTARLRALFAKKTGWPVTNPATSDQR